MYSPRNIKTNSTWLDSDGIKIFTISIANEPVDQNLFVTRLEEVKSSRDIDWRETPAFAIFHKGENLLYLVLAWWGNDNELFTSVSVLTDSGWVEDRERFSFCLFDMEVFWSERIAYIETMYSGTPNIENYRKQRCINV